MWNAFKSGFDSVTSALSNLPSTLWNAFKTGFDTVSDWLSDIFDKIKELPTTILNGIKSIFIPDMEKVNTDFNSSLEQISSKFGLQEIKLDTLANTSTSPTDITESYNIYGIGSKKYKFFDTKYLIKGVEYFRPFIRGFIVLLLSFYNYKMFLGFIGHDSGMIANSVGGKKGEE